MGKLVEDLTEALGDKESMLAPKIIIKGDKMFKDAQVGDKVYDYYLQEWGTIKEITSSSEYPILVTFDDNTGDNYTYEGKRYSYVASTLFWDKPDPIIPPKKPLPSLEIDTKVLVWDSKGEPKRRRYFSNFNENGKIRCFALGNTSWTTEDVTTWKYWELWNEQDK